MSPTTNREAGTIDVRDLARTLAPSGYAAPRAARVLGQSGYLRAGLHPAIDELRTEHLRLLAQMRDAGQAVADLRARHVAADEAFEAAALEAAKTGKPFKAPEPLSDAAREQELRAPMVALRAALQALEAHGVKIRDVFREIEDELLADLQAQRAAAQSRREAIEAEMAALKHEELALVFRGGWVQRVSNDGDGDLKPALAAAADDVPPGAIVSDEWAFKRHPARLPAWHPDYVEAVIDNRWYDVPPGTPTTGSPWPGEVAA